MSIELNRFTSEILNQNPLTREAGLAKGSHFEVVFGFPTKLNVGARETEVLSLRCDSISFPSRAPLSSDVKHFGPTSKRIYGFDSAPVTATIILSQNMVERDLFLKWQDIAVGDSRRTRDSQAGSFLVGYYENYISDITINKYNESGFKTMSTKLIDAYPSFVGEVGTDWGSDDFLKVNVTFTYRYFTDDMLGSGFGTDARLAALFKAAVNGRFEDEAKEAGKEIINTEIRNRFPRF